MIAKIAVLFAVVAFANAGVIQSPASTTLLANHIPVAVASPAITYAVPSVSNVAAVRTVATAPLVAAPVVQAGHHIVQTGHHVVQTVEPVEQHGYKIAY